MERVVRRPRGSRQPPSNFGKARPDYQNKSTEGNGDNAQLDLPSTDKFQWDRYKGIDEINELDECGSSRIPNLPQSAGITGQLLDQKDNSGVDASHCSRFDLYSPDLNSLKGQDSQVFLQLRTATVDTCDKASESDISLNLMIPTKQSTDSAQVQNKENMEPQYGEENVSQCQTQHRVKCQKLSANSCIVCQMPLIRNDRGVRTEYGLTHLQCFRCSECGESLEHCQFYFENSRLYCHLDYHDLYSPKCAFCKTPVESKGVSAIGKTFHSNHFFCTQCSKVLGSDDTYYIIDNDKVCCSVCHDSKTKLACWKCKFATNQLIDALGRTWCSSCFICDSCTQNLDQEFILREDGDIVCKNCEIRRIKLDSWS